MKSIEIDLDVNRAIEMGRQNFSESANAILRRLLAIDGRRVTARPGPRPRSPRSSGAYSTLVGTRQVEANSLKELLRRAILLAEKQQPGLTAKLAAVTTRRGRRIVARDPALLYPNSPHLAEFAERLDGDWWVDGNVGREQVLSYLKTIAGLLGAPHLPTLHKRSEKTTILPEDLGIA